MNISFMGRIIDMHTHSGKWQNRQYSVNDVTRLGQNLKNDTVDTFIMSNTDCFEKVGDKPRKTELDGNRALIDEIKNNKQVKVMLVADPENGNVEHIKTLYNENPEKIVGLKFHSKVSGLEASSNKYDAYLKFAEEHKFPCLFHSQVDSNPNIIDPSDPRKIYELAKRHPKVPIILGHTGAGGEAAHKIAIDTIIESVKNNDANLYADISWMDWQNNMPSENKPSVMNLVERLDKKGETKRILFGTDAPLGCYGENVPTGETPQSSYQKTIDTLKTSLKNKFPDKHEKLADDILYNNSKKLFLDRIEPKKEVEQVVKKVSKFPIVKTAAIVIGTIGAATAAYFGIKHNKK